MANLEPGTLVSFPHRDGLVVGYVDHVEELGNGRSVAICPGIRMHLRPYPNRAPPSINWRVPVEDVSVLQSSVDGDPK